MGPQRVPAAADERDRELSFIIGRVHCYRRHRVHGLVVAVHWLCCRGMLASADRCANLGAVVFAVLELVLQLCVCGRLVGAHGSQLALLQCLSWSSWCSLETREGSQRSFGAIRIDHFVYCCIAVALHAQLSQRARRTTASKHLWWCDARRTR